MDGALGLFAILGFFLSIVAISVAVAARASMSNAQSDVRMAGLARRIAALEAHAGMAAPGSVSGASAPGAPDGMDDVLDLVEAGQKIAAIKLYREKTGVGLAEAKGAVEDLEVARAQA